MAKKEDMNKWISVKLKVATWNARRISGKLTESSRRAGRGKYKCRFYHRNKES